MGEGPSKVGRRASAQWERDVGSIGGKLGSEMVENLVGGGREASGVGESEVGCHEKVGEVGCVDLAGDLCVVASGACVLEDGAVVGRVNPDEFESSVAEVGVGGAKVGDGDVGLGEEGKASEVEGISGVVGTADSDDGAGVKG